MRKTCHLTFAAALIALSELAYPATVDQAHAAVEAKLKDPSSAQYRNEKTVGAAVCGEYNAKNGFGGYVGFRPYMVDDAGLHELKNTAQIEAENRATHEGELNILHRAQADAKLIRETCLTR